jgi:hypothetical protein
MATIIKSGVFDGMVLTALNDGTDLFLQAYVPGNTNQTWDLSNPQGVFTIINRGTGQFISYPGGNAEKLSLVPSTPNPPADNINFHWGDMEEWGARALQWNFDQGQNVSAGINTPDPGPLHTRGWRHGNQRELTWITETV